MLRSFSFSLIREKNIPFYERNIKGGTTMGIALLTATILLIAATENAVVVNKRQEEIAKDRTMK